MARIMYTNSEIKSIIKSMVILCDTREQKNGHITAAFDNAGIRHESRTLNTGDYTVMLPALPEYDLIRPVCFDDTS